MRASELELATMPFYFVIEIGDARESESEDTTTTVHAIWRMHRRENMRRTSSCVIISGFFHKHNTAPANSVYSPHLVPWRPHISTIDLASIAGQSAVFPGRSLGYGLD